jgi:hypothetical protein
LVHPAEADPWPVALQHDSGKGKPDGLQCLVEIFRRAGRDLPADFRNRSHKIMIIDGE